MGSETDRVEAARLVDDFQMAVVGWQRTRVAYRAGEATRDQLDVATEALRDTRRALIDTLETPGWPE